MIQWNSDLTKRMACHETEKAALPELIGNLMGIAVKAKNEGIKALSKDSRTADDAFLSYGLRLVSEGIAVETLEEILAISLAASTATGFEFLKLCVNAEAIVSIAGGDLPEITMRKLVPYCGAEKAGKTLEILESSYSETRS